MEGRKCSISACDKESQVFAVVVEDEGPGKEASFCSAHAEDMRRQYLQAVEEITHGESLGNTFEQCKLLTVVAFTDSQQYLLVLKSIRQNLFLVVSTGYNEAWNLANIVLRRFPSLPSTHQLMGRIVSLLDSSVQKATVAKYDRVENCFRCRLSLKSGQVNHEVDCRITDAMALSELLGFPVEVNSSLLVSRGREKFV